MFSFSTVHCLFYSVYHALYLYFVENKLRHVAAKYNKQELYDVYFLTDIALHLNENNKLSSASSLSISWLCNTAAWLSLQHLAPCEHPLRAQGDQLMAA